MSGPKRNPDKLNTIGVVVIGICAAVLVYVTIVALQAFYVDDTSEIQTMADYGGQDTQARQIRQDQTGMLTAQSTPNPAPTKATEVQSYRIPVKYAIKYVVDGAKVSPNKLVPIYGPSNKSTVLTPDKAKAAAATGAGAGAGSGATEPVPGSGSGSAAPLTPTGGLGQGGGAPPAGAAPAGAGSANPQDSKTPGKDTKVPAEAKPPVPKDPKTPAPKDAKMPAPKTPANAGSAAKGNGR